MNKVKLTIIKDSPAAQAGHTTIVQEVELKAEQCAGRFFDDGRLDGFRFGNAIIYTHGVQAFIFEDVKE